MAGHRWSERRASTGEAIQAATASAKTTTKTSAATKFKPAPKDAIALLKADHEAVSQLFAEVEKTRSVPNKKALVAEIFSALSVHAPIEEEIFYPAATLALKNKLLVPEATVEHATVKDLIAQLAAPQRQPITQLAHWAAHRAAQWGVRPVARLGFTAAPWCARAPPAPDSRWRRRARSCRGRAKGSTPPTG